MKKETRLSFNKTINIFIVSIPFIVVWFFYYADRTLNYTGYATRCAVLILYYIMYFFFCKTYDAFTVPYLRIREMVSNQILSVLLTDTVMFILLWIMSYYFPNFLIAFLCLTVQILFAVIWCVITRKWYYKTFPPRKTVILYNTSDRIDNLISKYELEHEFSIERVINVKECIDDLSVLNGTDTVIFSDVHSHERNIILKYCVEIGISSFMIPRLGDVIMSGAKTVHMLHLPVLKVERFCPSIAYRILKRTFDIIFSGVLLILCIIPMLVLAVLIKRDGGPAFYKQTRLTKDGKQFKLIKFRSMRIDAEKDGIARLSAGNDDERITPIGRKIRATRFDELPQLINILKGDMSFVGPRPERPEIVEQYEKEIPDFRLRLQCKAGLTGYAQVFGKYNTTPYDKLNMDLTYISRASVTEDIRLVLATISILFLPESTEGVEKDQVTAMKS